MKRKLSVLLFLLLTLAACEPQPELPVLVPWQYSDLRTLDPADAANPTQDLIAAYTRQVGDQVQIRLDFLDLAMRSDFDLYLALDTAPGGTSQLPFEATSRIQWDTLIQVPASGPIRILGADFQPRTGLAILALRDPVQDTISLSLNRAALEEPFQPNSALGFSFQVFVTPASSPALEDSLGPARSDGPPPDRARVLFVFWDTFPAYTPAQALRRWDGAHTGPLGARHGLYNLLRTARNHKIPLVLLDLKTPTSLSAVDYAGGMDLVKNMAANNLLILPDALPTPLCPENQALECPLASPPDWALTRAAEDSRMTASQFGLPATQFLFSPAAIQAARGPSPLHNYRITFHFSAASQPLQTVNPQRWQDQVFIPVPIEPQDKGITLQATQDGPSLEIRRALVQAALSTSEIEQGSAPILVLGGDLPNSSWGDPQSARASFGYLVSHPWVQALTANDLLSLKPKAHLEIPESSLDQIPQNQADLLDRLMNTPPGPVAEAAWQAYLALFEPTFPEPLQLPQLRASYLGQVGDLLAAADWVAHPKSISDCSQDLDQDGKPECILASTEFFSLYEPEEGSLTFAFARIGGVHQLVAPSSQFASGLSEAGTWELNQGLASDPSVFPGAFRDGGAPYQAKLDAGQITFSSTQGTWIKIFRLTPGGLSLEYHSNEPILTQVPLVIDPWLRFYSDWGKFYSGFSSENQWVWGVQTGFRVQLQSTGHLIPQTFTDTRNLMGNEENPNYEFPPGHFLPFPLSVVEVSGQGVITIQISPILSGN